MNAPPTPLTKKVTLADLRAVRQSTEPAAKMPVLTCYDFLTARLMQEAGVPALLVGDSAANVVLGFDSTLPVSLSFMIDITAAVRRGAPLAFLMADMPFGSYGASLSQGVRNVCRMIKRTGCDAVKLEASSGHHPLFSALAEIGVAAIAHLGLKPQSVGLIGGYRFQGRTADEAEGLVCQALQMEEAGAAGLLLEAVPPEVARTVVERTRIPVIGCGAGSACHASVIVTQDALGLTPQRPRFVPTLADMSAPLIEAYASYVHAVRSGAYPAASHEYVMPPKEKAAFLRNIEKWNTD